MILKRLSSHTTVNECTVYTVLRMVVTLWRGTVGSQSNIRDIERTRFLLRRQNGTQYYFDFENSVKIEYWELFIIILPCVDEKNVGEQIRCFTTAIGTYGN